MIVKIGMNYVRHMPLLNAITQRVLALREFCKKKKISLALVLNYDSSQSQTSKNLYNVCVEYIGKDVAVKIEKERASGRPEIWTSGYPQMSEYPAEHRTPK